MNSPITVASGTPATPSSRLESLLTQYETASANLACAEGLPGAESIDRDSCLSTIAWMADWLEGYTERLLPKFRRQPHDYENSESFFRVLCMVCGLQEHFGVHYNEYQKCAQTTTNPNYPKRYPPLMSDSRHSFIHGLVMGLGGNCVSMPILYVAVGRRLGYPLYLVTVKSHAFVRWDDTSTGERFNIEGTNRGAGYYQDSRYHHWPRELTQEEIGATYDFLSLTPLEELALFLDVRADCLYCNGQVDAALTSITKACDLNPRHLGYRYKLDMLICLHAELKSGIARHYPLRHSPLSVGTPGFFIKIPAGARDVHYYEDLVARLGRDQLRFTLRKGVRPCTIPT